MNTVMTEENCYAVSMLLGFVKDLFRMKGGIVHMLYMILCVVPAPHQVPPTFHITITLRHEKATQPDVRGRSYKTYNVLTHLLFI